MLIATLEQHGSKYLGACFVAKTHACMKELITTNIKEKSLARNKLKASTQHAVMIKPQEFIRKTRFW